MPLIDQQLKGNDCGISAIKTVFNVLGKEIDRNYIRDHIFVDETGSSLRDIRNFFERNGCQTKYRLLDINLPGKASPPFKAMFPFILTVKRGGQLHYVVVNGQRGRKLKIFDPARQRPYLLSFEELRATAHYTNSYWPLVDFKDRLQALCAPELANYDLSLDESWTEGDIATVFNKLVYFTHLRDRYGFRNKQGEKDFLTDLLFTQTAAAVPRQFRQLKQGPEKIKLSAPLVLSVMTLPDKKIQDGTGAASDNVYRKLLAELGSNRRLWAIYLFTGLFAAGIAQLTVFLSQILIDHVLPSFQLRVLTLFAVGFALFRIFTMLITQYKRFVAIHVGNILDKYFLVTFNEKLNNFSLKYAHTFRKGDLTERLSDSMNLKAFFVNIFSSLLVDTFVSVSSLLVLFYINWKLTMLVCTVIVFYYAWFRIITPHLQMNEKRRFIAKADFISKMIERIDGNQVIKCFQLGSLFSNRLRKNIRELIDIQTRTKYIGLLNSSTVSLISTAAYTLIVVLLARDFMIAQAVSFGQLITFIMLAERVFTTLSSILDENLTLQENEVILRRYFDFHEAPTGMPSGGMTDFTIERMCLRKLNFGYDPSTPVLKDIDFEFNRGNKVRIQGSNGSGKSSLSKILSFLYEPDKGDIMVNEVKSSFFSTEALKKKIHLVSNEDILFNESIEFNIGFGREISQSDIIALSKAVGLYEFISRHDEGLQFLINENGKNLSTGQRKKILVMRALLSEAEVIILDEVLAGIDLASREKIESVIADMGDKTFIVISHEPVRTIKFDRNFALNNGELVFT